MEYDIGAGESVSTAVRRVVSAVKGCKPSELDPIAHSVDPDALDELFGTREDGLSRTGGRISFIYSDCHISIDNAEYLTIEPVDDHFIDSQRAEVDTD